MRRSIGREVRDGRLVFRWWELRREYPFSEAAYEKPAIFGFAYWDYPRGCAVCYPIPINVLVRAWHHFFAYLRMPFNGRLTPRERAFQEEGARLQHDARLLHLQRQNAELCEEVGRLRRALGSVRLLEAYRDSPVSHSDGGASEL